jgi:hypothetical protein
MLSRGFDCQEGVFLYQVEDNVGQWVGTSEVSPDTMVQFDGSLEREVS